MHHVGGVPRKEIARRFGLVVKKGTDRIENQRFHAFRGEWILHVDFCAAGKGWEQGSVERGVENVRGVVFRPVPKVASFDELNAWILAEFDRGLDRRRLGGMDVRRARRLPRSVSTCVLCLTTVPGPGESSRAWPTSSPTCEWIASKTMNSPMRSPRLPTGPHPAPARRGQAAPKPRSTPPGGGPGAPGLKAGRPTGR